jgi:hypothetical protein
MSQRCQEATLQARLEAEVGHMGPLPPSVVALPDVSWYSALRSLRIHFDPSAGVCLSQ